MQEVKSPKKPFLYYCLIVATIMVLLNSLVFPNVLEHSVKEVDYNTFMKMTENKEIGKVNIDSGEIIFTDKSEEKMYKTGVMDDPGLVDRLYDSGADFSSKITEEMSPILYFLLSYILPIAIFIMLGRWLSKKMMSKMNGGANPMNSMMFGGGKSNAKIYVKSSNGIKFSDVAGEDEAKELLSEIVDYLHDPDKYREMGAAMPKGALLVGPPGTGKTLLAKAVAGEANVPFFSISGSEFVEMFVGMGAAKVRDLFQQANEKAPCIVFIDEIDAIGKKRNGNIGGNDEREQTLNQLLTEMDGFDGTKGVVILAATNQPDSLDPALLRPGRFDRRIPVELPDLKGREEILRVHGKKIRLSDNVDFAAVARTAAGASGAELANIVNEAALRAVRRGSKVTMQEDLEESVETVIAGYQKKNRILSTKEKLTVSYHEIGHALVAAKQTDSAPVQKITIIPRTSGALGYTMQVDEGEHFLMTKSELLNKITTFTGGRAAEELVFKEVTTGASNDIEQATKLARAMLTQFGMSDEFDMVAMETVQNQYLGGDASLTCSPETQTKIDSKVVEIVREAHTKALQILKENETKLHELARYLYENETITGEEFMQILQRQDIDSKEPALEVTEE
ncbi:MAG: ATP-dependent zinc metalloprotease FtsH [Mediterraneibacter gnavus]